MLIEADARLGRHSYYEASAPCAPPPLQGRAGWMRMCWRMAPTFKQQFGRTAVRNP